MTDLIESINNAMGLTDSMFCLLLTLISVVLTYFVGKLAIKKFPFEDLVESGEGIGSYCNVIGVLYAIVLGYVLVNVYESFSLANEKVENEASLVIDLLRDAEGLPGLQSMIYRKATMDYVDSVIDKEWQYMIINKDFHPETFEKFSNLYHLAKGIECDSEEQRIFLTEIVTRLNELSAIRRERVQLSTARLPDMLWAMLVGVGLVSFLMCFIFPIENNKIRIAMLCSTAGVMMFTTLLIYILDRPYNGTLGVKPDSLEKIREIVLEKGLEKEWDEALDMKNQIKSEFIKRAIEKGIVGGSDAGSSEEK